MIIGFDMGHTVEGANYGAVGIIKESEETRNLGYKIIRYIESLGHRVINCTVDRAVSNSDSLNTRVKKANAQRLDIFVSIHFNSGGGKGSEVLTYKGRVLPEAERVLSGLFKVGFLNRGIKNGTYPRKLAVINNVNYRSMIIEVCFVDNIIDVELYKKNIDKIAKIIAEEIVGERILDLEGDVEMIPDSVKLSACRQNSISTDMIENIKSLQGIVNINKDGVATEELIRKLPELLGNEQRGCVNIMQRILILKGFSRDGSDTGVIGPANKNALSRFKSHVGIPEGTLLVDRLTWRKLLEY